MKVLVITTENEIYAEDIKEPVHDNLRLLIGNDIVERVRPAGLDTDYVMCVDEDGLNKELDVNLCGCCLYGPAEHGHPIVGTIVIAKFDGMDYEDMPDDELEYLKEAFLEAYSFLEERI